MCSQCQGFFNIEAGGKHGCCCALYGSGNHRETQDEPSVRMTYSKLPEANLVPQTNECEAVGVIYN
jgi:hypothetical protein